MKNLFVLPTDTPSRLQQFEGVDGIEFELCSKNEFFNKGMNIHITNDEEIKEGDIALKRDKLVRITEVEIKKTPITKKVKTGFLKHKTVDTGKVKTVIQRVWWQEVGQEWSNQQQSSSLSHNYDWEEMIRRANFIIKQVGKL